MRRTLLIVPLFVCFALVGLGAWNYFTVSRPVALVSGNQLARVWTHYQHYVNPSVLSFDLRTTGGSSMMDVYVVLLHSARALSSHHFQKVELLYHGHLRFILDGLYFKQLGNEYAFQSPFYTITGRTSPLNPPTSSIFTSHLLRPDGAKAFPELTQRVASGGGLVGMLSQMTDESDEFGKALDQFNEFSRVWYLEETVKE